MSISDSEIITAIREGRDQMVVKSIYDNVLPNVKRFIVANAGNNEDALDIFHDAMLVFFKLVMAGKYDAEKYKVYGFVYTICRNLWINQAKKKTHFAKWSEFSEKEEFDETVLEQLISKEKLTLVKKLLNDLGDKCVEVLTLFMYNELSYREIAVKMGFESESAAKVKAHRCRKALTEKIKTDRYIFEQLRN
jgi:RNA polymerase sigma factor (sigma-70 family)